MTSECKCVACRYINLLDLSDLFWLYVSQPILRCTDSVTLWDTWPPDRKMDADLLCSTISFYLCLDVPAGVVPYLFRLWFFNILLTRSRRNVDSSTSKNCDAICGRAKIFLLSKASRPLVEVTQGWGIGWLYPQDKAARTWIWPLISVWNRCYEWMELYLHSHMPSWIAQRQF